MKKGRIIAIAVVGLSLVCACVFLCRWFAPTGSSGSANSDLIEDAIRLEGEVYEGKVISDDTTGKRKTVYMEDRSIQVSRQQRKRWDATMPKEDHNGVPFNTSAWIWVYTCRIDTVRYIVKDGEVDQASVAHQYIDYTGYEDTDLNSGARAVLDPDSKMVSYSDKERFLELGNEKAEYVRK